MAFKDFANNQFIRSFDTDEIVRMGSFSTVSSLELSSVRVLAFVKGTLAGNERIRLKIFTDPAFSKLLHTSQWSNLSGITGEGDVSLTGDFLGMVRVDFNRQNINKTIVYYVACEISDYTPIGDTFFVGLSHDFPSPRYAGAVQKYYQTNLAFEIFGYGE